jgi:PilZ domain-containing protein
MNSDAINQAARLFVRHETRYEAAVDVHPDHAEQFRLSFPDTQSILAVIDVSKGGLGLSSPVFMPKNLRITLTIADFGAPAGKHGVALRIRGIVRRCVMFDHKPTYQLGLQFVDPAGRDEQLLVAGAAQEKSGRAPAAMEGVNRGT